MPTECTKREVVFQGHGRRGVTAQFDGGRLSSDGGAVLLREADGVLDVTRRLAGCFTDHRSPERREHTLSCLVAQRVMGIALGYEDLNDHDQLRDDSVLALAVGRDDLTGAERVRERDRGHPLASSSTLNRLELGTPAEAGGHRYKRIVADPDAIDRLMVALFVESHDTVPGKIVLDIDATDDPLHGHQEGRFFHGYYDCYCYLPLYITCGDHVLCSRLRSSNIDASSGSVTELTRIVGQIRASWPTTRILVRGDSGFCREEIMAWCEANDVDYLFGLARTPRLVAQIGRQLRRSHSRCVTTGRASRRFRDFRYRTLTSWSRSRRVVGKAEVLAGRRGRNPRFVVTSLTRRQIGARELYEDLYCARGDMENRIKEQQLDLFADRTSTATMRANQLRLYFSVFAGILLQIIRDVGLAGTKLARAQYGTIRVTLLKIACQVRLSVRRVLFSLSSIYPRQHLFAQVALALRRAAAARSP